VTFLTTFGPPFVVNTTSSKKKFKKSPAATCLRGLFLKTYLCAKYLFGSNRYSRRSPARRDKL
jgi:hypothetical protein